MNLEYLGDALDHWKGALFEYLQTRGSSSFQVPQTGMTDYFLFSWLPDCSFPGRTKPGQTPGQRPEEGRPFFA